MKPWQQILKDYGMPPRFYLCDFVNHPATKPKWNELKAYARNPDRNIFMSGPCGKGKTITAVCLMALWTHLNGRGARFFNSETLYPTWLDEARTGSPNAFAKRLNDCPFLILDDLGQGEISDSFKRWLYSIINNRWEWQRPIVCTSNLTSTDFRNLFGDAILSRLSDGHIWKFNDNNGDHRMN